RGPPGRCPRGSAHRPRTRVATASGTSCRHRHRIRTATRKVIHSPRRARPIRDRRGRMGDMADSPPPAPRFLAPAQVAELLDIEVDEVVSLIMAGRLRGSQLGSPARWRVEESSLADYLAEQTEEARRMALWRQA